MNGKIRRAMESIRDWGRDCYCKPGYDNTCGKRFAHKLGGLPPGYDHKYTYSHLGFNLKITDMQAAVGLAQLDKLPSFIAARKENFEGLKQKLSDLEMFFEFPEAAPNSEPSWFGFLLTVKDNAPFTRNEIVRFLDSKNIGTRFLFGGNLVHQPYMKNYRFRVDGNLKNSDKVMNQTFWIGVYPGISSHELDFLSASIHSFCQRY